MKIGRLANIGVRLKHALEIQGGCECESYIYYIALMKNIIISNLVEKARDRLTDHPSRLRESSKQSN